MIPRYVTCLVGSGHQWEEARHKEHNRMEGLPDRDTIVFRVEVYERRRCKRCKSEQRTTYLRLVEVDNVSKSVICVDDFREGPVFLPHAPPRPDHDPGTTDE